MILRIRPFLPAMCVALSLAACGAPPPETESDSNRTSPAATVSAPESPAAPEPVPRPGAPAPATAPRWQMAASGEGDALFLQGSGGGRVVTLFCPAQTSDLLVNVPGFGPIGSEERMTFGSGDIAVTLVADPRGDSGRGGVTGRGRLPDELAAILSGPEGLSVNYGAQYSGPHGPPPPESARLFLKGCLD